MRKASVLVVEDDLDFMNDLVIFLSSEYVVFKAEDSRVALRLFEKEHPDCCVIDINLPHFLNKQNDCEGLSLARELYTRTSKRTEFIFISRDPFPEGTDTVPDYKFIQKPLMIGNLLNTINIAMRT